jgi:hypothetical protein
MFIYKLGQQFSITLLDVRMLQSVKLVVQQHLTLPPTEVQKTETNITAAAHYTSKSPYK